MVIATKEEKANREEAEKCHQVYHSRKDEHKGVYGRDDI